MNLRELKIELEGLILELEEVRAYRELQSVGFDFGTGYIKPESTISEDAYYEMIEQNLEEEIENIIYLIRYWSLENETYKSKKRNNRYFRKQLRKRKLQKLEDEGSYFITTREDENGEYLVRFYLSGPRGLAKRYTNRAVRQSRNNFPLKGGGYRKKFDYWWTVF